ncbi:hypothetical protein AMECASPLE_032023 [Ameca splendens]|uniref:Uncharacterized protein n=1 Tax=Ameca splendens TaxID=208324 RepID=A0ABV0XVI3_9TELE
MLFIITSNISEVEFKPRIKPYQVFQLDRLNSLTPMHSFSPSASSALSSFTLSDSEIFSSSLLTLTSSSSSSLISSPVLSVTTFTFDPLGLYHSSVFKYHTLLPFHPSPFCQRSWKCLHF